MELGFWSLVPPLLTIILALTTKNVFIFLLYHLSRNHGTS